MENSNPKVVKTPKKQRKPALKTVSDVQSGSCACKDVPQPQAQPVQQEVKQEV
jgi:hypothetical protein